MSLKCISMQYLIKIYRAVQELWAFSLKDLDRLKWCSAKPHRRFAYQWLNNVKINKYAKFDPNITIWFKSDHQWAFSLTDPDPPDGFLAKDRHRFTKQCLDNVKMYNYAKFDQTIRCSLGVMSIFTKIPQKAEIMLREASSPFCIPVAEQC